MEGQEIQMEDGKGFGLRGSKIGELKKKKKSKLRVECMGNFEEETYLIEKSAKKCMWL